MASNTIRTSVLLLFLLSASVAFVAAQIFLPAVPPAPAAPASAPASNASLSITTLPIVPPTFEVHLVQRTGNSLFCEIYLDLLATGVTLTLADGETASRTLSDVPPGQRNLTVLCVNGSSAQFTASTLVTIVAQTATQIELTLDAPASVSSPFEVLLRHSADESLSCTLGVDVHLASGFRSSPFPIGANEEVTINVSNLALGAHNLSGSCVHGGENITVSKIVTVANLSCQTNASCPATFACGPQGVCVERNPNITFLAPVGSVRPGQVNVTFRHAAATTMQCRVAIDDYEWSDDDPRWLNASFTKNVSVAAGASATATFAAITQGTHIAHVLCDTASLQAEGFLTFEVSADIANTTGASGVRITLLAPLATAPRTGDVVFVHNGTSQASCSVSIDSGAGVVRTVPQFSIATVPYSVGAGDHAVAIVCTAIPWTASVSRTFAASAAANTTTTPPTNGTRYTRPSVVIIGTPSAGVPFSIVGDGFPAGTVDLYVTGQGKTVRNSTSANAKGSFSHTWPGLEAGTYAITAKSASDASIMATRTVSVLPRETVPQTPPTLDVIGRNPVPAQQQRAATPPVPLESRAEPAAIDPGFEVPEQIAIDDGLAEDDDSLGWLAWTLIVFGIIIAGLGGYLVFNGSLNVRSWGGFVQSLEDIKASGLRIVQSTPKVPSDAALAQDPHALEREIMRQFIEKERRRGSDDLAIHEALIAQGWERASVDALFDELRR